MILLFTGKDRWTEQAMDRYEQQVQVRQDEGINLI